MLPSVTFMSDGERSSLVSLINIFYLAVPISRSNRKGPSYVHIAFSTSSNFYLSFPFLSPSSSDEEEEEEGCAHLLQYYCIDPPSSFLFSLFSGGLAAPRIKGKGAGKGR